MSGSAPDFPAWRAARPNGRFTDWLRERAGSAWQQAVAHRFVHELADGGLANADFRRYIVQDYAFIETLVTVMGFAVARAEGMAAKRRLTSFLAVLTSEENDYFMRAFQAVEASPTNELAPVTRALRQTMLEAAHAGGYADVLAVIVPAEWIYLSWASAHADASPRQWHYREWIELHCLPAFADFVDWLRSELDRLGPTLPPARIAEIEARFQRLVELEVDFFEQAYG